MTRPVALVTGASGFLGSHVVGALRARGHQVRALVRPTSDLFRLAGQDVDLAFADLSDFASLRAAVEGVSVVVHTAGRVSDWGPREAFLEANVDGTRRLLDACRSAGVPRLVHVSSLTVLGLPRTREVVTEDTPYAEAPPDFYTQTKIAGEKLVREAHGQGLGTTVIRPGVIWGRGDTTILPRFIRLLRQGRMIYVDGGRNLIALAHAQNLAHGCALAAETQAAAGRVYHVIDAETLTAREALDALAAATGGHRPRISLPFGAVHAIAGLMERVALARHSPEPPPFSRYGVRLVSCDCRYDTSRARDELGYEPVISFEDGIAGLAAEAAV